MKNRIVEVEKVLNSRPLCMSRDDPSDAEVLLIYPSIDLWIHLSISINRSITVVYHRRLSIVY